MYISVLDKDFIEIKLIEEYDSFIWTERYNSLGDMSLVTIPTKNNLEIFKIGNYIFNSESSTLMYITKVDIKNESTGTKLTVTGESLEGLLNRRIVWKNRKYPDDEHEDGLETGYIEDCVKKLLNENVIFPELDKPVDEESEEILAEIALKKKRKIPNFVFKKSNNPYVTDAKYKNEFNNEELYDAIRNACETCNVAFKVTYNKHYDENGDVHNDFVCEVYKGIDRTDIQYKDLLDNNKMVVFSPFYDNFYDVEYIENVEDYTNSILVGEGSGGSSDSESKEYREVFLNDDDSYSSLERFEGYSECEKPDENSDDDTEVRCYYSGHKFLQEHEEIEAIQGTVNSDVMYKCNKDYFLGDIVFVEDTYGHVAKCVVSEVIFSVESDGYKNYPTLEFYESAFNKLDHIESDGRQYLDTGLLGDNYTKIRVEGSLLDNNSTGLIATVQTLFYEKDHFDIFYENGLIKCRLGNTTTDICDTRETSGYFDVTVGANISDKLMDENTKVLPDGYFGLDYVESTDSQYLDLDMVLEQGMKISYELQDTSDANGYLYGVEYQATSGNLYSNWLNLTKGIESRPTSIDIVDNVKLTLFAKRKYDETVEDKNERTTYEYSNGIKLKSFKIENSSEKLVMDLVPCYTFDSKNKTSGKKIGLYDFVNGKFFSSVTNQELLRGSSVDFVYSHYDKDVGYTSPTNIQADFNGSFDGKLLLFSSKELNNIPENYTEVDYLRYTGTDWFDLGITPTPSTNIVIEMSINNYNPNGQELDIIGNDHTTIDNRNSTYNICVINKNDQDGAKVSGLWYNIFGTNANSDPEKEKESGHALDNVPADSVYIGYSDNFYKERHVYSFSNEIIKIDNMDMCKVKKGRTPEDASGTLHLFGNGENDICIYNLKIYDGTLKMDLIPCVNENGEAFFYDAVSENNYGSGSQGLSSSVTYPAGSFKLFECDVYNHNRLVMSANSAIRKIGDKKGLRDNFNKRFLVNKTQTDFK